ncbi:YdcF family protein [Peribacillus sp. B-H-3]|uniref:YdcF family protein n=1 Tax=Peribacillus sp. B-H-3 TaxID=3400420 RepID=UPI003B02B6F2
MKPYDCITDFIFYETEIEKADLILIPGSRQKRLMEKAAFLYSEGYAPLILPSGGYQESLKGTEWEFLRNIGVSLGVPQDVILKEDKARNTFENARYSWEVVKQHSLQLKKVILVTKAFHSRRALMTYQTVFPETIKFMVCTVPDYGNITKDNWHSEEKKIRVVMNEVVNIGNYFPDHIKKWS